MEREREEDLLSGGGLWLEGEKGQERHAIVAQRASPLRSTSRLKARHLFFGVFGFSRIFLVISSFHHMSYVVWVYVLTKGYIHQGTWVGVEYMRLFLICFS